MVNAPAGVRPRIKYIVLSCLSMCLWLDCFSGLSSFWKTATLGQGEFGEFSLVQGSKNQLNQLWYRLRVPGPQQHIPTQKSLKYASTVVRKSQFLATHEIQSRCKRQNFQILDLQRLASLGRGLQRTHTCQQTG